MDTTKDIRIIFIEKLVENFKRQISQGIFGSLKRYPHIIKGLQEISNALFGLKYSYMDDASLSQMPEQDIIIKRNIEISNTLRDLHRNNRDILAIARFYDLSFRQFRTSFALPSSLESAVAVAIGCVNTVSKHPKAKKLLLCNVEVFGEELLLVTNLLKTRPTQLMKVAMVYPEEIINILSEAQFVGEAAPADAATSPTPLTEEQKQEIRRTMGKYLEI